MKGILFRLITATALLMFVGCEWDWFNNTEVPQPDPVTKFVCNAKHFDGEYYGDYYNPGVGNYFIHISTKGFQESGFPMPNGTYFRIDLYGALYEGDNTDTIPVPKGIYKLDKNNTLAAGTFSMAYSNFLKSDSEGYFNKTESFDQGELQITDEGAKLVVRMGNIEYTAIFEGDTVVKDMRSELGNGGVTDGVISTLTEDYSVVLDNHELLYDWCGDYYNTGIQNWMVVIWPKNRVGDCVQFDLMSKYTSTNSFYGDYTVGNSRTNYSFLKGSISGNASAGYYIEGSWYYTYDSTMMAPFVDGTLSITYDSSNDITSVTFSLIDDRGNTIDGNWSGKAQMY